MGYKKLPREIVSEVRRAAVNKRWEGKTQEDKDAMVRKMNKARLERRAALREFQRELQAS